MSGQTIHLRAFDCVQAWVQGCEREPSSRDRKRLHQAVAELLMAERASKDEVIDALTIARHTVTDLRRGFAANVDPQRWVEQFLAHCDAALAKADGR